MRLIVAGPRDFWNFEFIVGKIKYYTQNVDWSLVCGDAPGVDNVAKNYAIANGIDVDLFPANWDELGKAAGPIRNKEMADNADALLAFDNGSPGTADMVKQAREKGLTVKIVKI